MSIISDINKEFEVRDKSMTKSIAWYEKNKNDINCPMLQAVELHMLGVDCRFMNTEKKNV